MDLRFVWFCRLLKVVEIDFKSDDQEIFEGFVAGGGWIPHQRPNSSKRARGANGALDAHLLNAAFHPGAVRAGGRDSRRASFPTPHYNLSQGRCSGIHITNLHIDEAIAA